MGLRIYPKFIRYISLFIVYANRGEKQVVYFFLQKCPELGGEAGLVYDMTFIC